MMNYGHPLTFGTFLTPAYKEPDAIVARAKRSEELGYDLVTFQDHPYQSAYLDTWTLLSWIAGQTERIRIAPNVLNMPLREPAMVARAAASLDLLSSGRLELALGAGIFWDGIKAMGGRQYAPGEAVDALSEAIDLIRGLWNKNEGRSFHFDGSYYHLNGAQRGPVPAHEIPIWIGAYKRRMLQLIGRKGDGWLPTSSYLQAGDIQAGNQIIDEAARKAGRDPREIRRLLNISGEFTTTPNGFLRGPAAQWVSDLLPLVVRDGVSTLILMSDDIETIERFAHEVMPALREATARELPEIVTPVRIRSAAARARRHSGIDYGGVPALLAESVIEPGDLQYGRVKSTYMRGGAPGIVFQVKSVEEIRAALAFARAHTHLPLGIRSGGHGISGRSTNQGGVVIDLSLLNKIEVLDRATRRVRIEAGARWMHVAAALEPYGWALSSGDYGGVGVGGLATAGGIGWLVRKHGLTIDHIRAVTMVLADGSVVRASEEEHADLFWAVRGAGANFGIVTDFEFEVDEVGAVGLAQLVFAADETEDFLVKWGAAVEAAPRDLTSFLIMGPPRLGRPFVAQAITVVASDQPEEIIAQLQPLASIAPLYDQHIVLTSYADVMANAQDADHDGHGDPVARSGLIEHITPAFAEAATRLLQSKAIHFFQIRSVGGAVADIDSDATAYGYRSANFSVTALGANRQRVNAVWDEMAGHFHGAYLSFETDLRPERLNDAFPPATLKRLYALKTRYDPDNIFRDNFNIVPGKELQESIQEKKR